MINNFPVRGSTGVSVVAVVHPPGLELTSVGLGDQVLLDPGNTLNLLSSPSPKDIIFSLLSERDEGEKSWCERSTDWSPPVGPMPLDQVSNLQPRYMWMYLTVNQTANFWLWDDTPAHWATLARAKPLLFMAPGPRKSILYHLCTGQDFFYCKYFKKCNCSNKMYQ